MKEPASDLATLVLAVVIAALARVTGFVGLTASYATAWMIVNAARAFGWSPASLSWSRSSVALVLALVLVVPVRDLAMRARAIAETEGLASPMEHLADRRALEASPAIAPGLVSTDRPQTFFVRADGAHVRVRFGPSLPWIEAEGMGHGVFRIDYDPRRDGAPQGHQTIATLEVDGSGSDRSMIAATPLAHPRWLRLSPDRSRACVPSEETDEVVVIAIGGEGERIETLDGPTDCAIDDDGALRVAHRWDARLLRLDAARARTTREIGPALAIAGTLVAHPHDVENLETGQRTSFEGEPLFLVASDARVYLATRSPAAILALDADGSLLARRALSTPAVHLTADEGAVFVALADYASDARPNLGNHFVQDRIASFDPRTLALRDDHLTAWRTERQDHAGDVDRGASPLGISRTPRGTSWIAFAGTDEIEELGGPSPRVIDTARLGLSAPFSVVELADRSLVVSSPSSGGLALLSPRGELVRTIALAPSDADLLASDRDALQLRFGERAFYEATRAGVSCQSCHLHGGTDGASNNIGGRIAAPTLDVRGLAGTSPYLRDGSYPRIRDLHEVAQTEYRGYRESAGDRGATIEAWLRTQPLPPTDARRDPALEREGLGVFFDAGCPACHAPPAFTSLGLHAIEAVFPDAPTRTEGRLLDVPSLRGVGASAPYLYDARARSLREVFTEQNRADRHGHTRELDVHALEALEAFLRSL